MIKVNCEACGAPYEVDPRRVPASGLKMRCPSCGAHVHVQAPAEPENAGGAKSFEVDLPAPKPGGGSKKFKGTQVGLGISGGEIPAARGAQALAAQDLTDLPAPKLTTQLTDALPDNDFADLPAPKGATMASPSAANDFADLPVVKGAAPKGAPANKIAPQAKLATPLDNVDLPAKKAEPARGGFQRPGGVAVKPAPATAEAPRARDSLPKDSLAMDPEPFFAGMKAAGALGDLDEVGEDTAALPVIKEDPNVDLPVAKAGTGTRPGGLDSRAKATFGTPKAPEPANPVGATIKKPAPAGTMMGLGISGNKLPKDSLDLPSALAASPELKSFGLGDDADLPIAKGSNKRAASNDLTDLPARKREASNAFDDLDLLPAPDADVDLPVAKKPAASGRGTGKFDVPGSVDLPAPKRTGTGVTKGLLGTLDLPGGDLPALKKPNQTQNLGDLDLPAPADLPAAKKPAASRDIGDLDLPAPADLPMAKKAGAPKAAFGDLDLPAPADLPVGKRQSLGSLGDLDLPAPADLPILKGSGALSLGDLDLPAPGDLPVLRGGDSLLGDLDLPAPADLPTLKQDGSLDLTPLDRAAGGRPKAPQDSATAMGIGPLSGGKGAAAAFQQQGSTAMGLGGIPKGGADFDFGSDLNLPPQRAKGGGITDFDSDLDLPPPGGGLIPEQSALIDFSKLGMPNSDLGSTSGLEFDELELPGESRSSVALPLPTLGTGMGGGSMPRGQTIELDFDAGSSIAMDFQGGSSNAALSSATFGDLDFGLGNAPAPAAAPAPPMPMPVPQHQNMRGGFDTASVEAELLGGETAAPAAPKKKKARGPAIALPGWALALIFVVVIAASGVSLGLFTKHGYFGVYLLEQALPAGGDPAKVSAAIAQAEKQARSDTYVDVRKSLATLSEARNEAGLNLELLSRSLLHEALYQLRFGDDPQSAQRSVAILARVMERSTEVRGLTLARAADAARSNRLDEATQLIRQAPNERDPYAPLVAGEIALLQKQHGEAEKAFERSLKDGGGARASWGLARARLAAGLTAKAEEAAKETLTLSPHHSGALTLMAQAEFARGNIEKALELSRSATGWTAVDGIRARPARHDRVEAWALQGKIQEKLDHTREALEAYEQALKVDPLRIEVLLGSGRMLMRMGRARDALSRFDSAAGAKTAAQTPEEGKRALIEAVNGAAEALLAQKRAPEARTRLEPLLKQYPDEASLHLSLGHTMQALERMDDAEQSFRAAIEKAPSSFGGYVALSQLLFKRDRPEEGARILSEATAKVADGAEVRRMLGQSELNRNHVPEAIHQFKQALVFDPRDAASLFGLAAAQRRQGALQDASESLAKLEALDPTHPGLPLERGMLFEARGDYDAAAESYRKALSDRPTDTDLKLRLGAALVTADKVDEADAILQQVLKDRPNSAEAEHYVGRVLFARKDTAQAVQRFERAVNFEQSRAEFHLYLAWASFEQGNLSGALQSVQKAIQLDTSMGDAYWILGRVQLRTGAVEDALDNLQHALKLKPGRVEALADLGDVYDQLRKLDDAVASYEKAVRARPANGEWWYKLGDLELDRGHRTQARVALSEATLRGDRLFEKPHWLPEAHRLYAEILREEKRWPEAVEHYRVYLEQAPATAPDRKEIEQLLKSMNR